jgi:GTP-binding protein HflX
MLSDTVGFVRDLPTNLIASFRATLEEATHADVLLIVLDVADRAARLQYQTVIQTLDDLFKEVEDREKRDGMTWHRPELILMLNKVDRLKDNTEVLAWTHESPGAIAINATQASHPGLETLRQRIRSAAQGRVEHLKITVPLSDGKTIHVIENRGQVIARDYDGSAVTLEVRIGRRQLDQLRSAGARMEISPA